MTLAVSKFDLECVTLYSLDSGGEHRNGSEDLAWEEGREGGSQGGREGGRDGGKRGG